MKALLFLLPVFFGLTFVSFKSQPSTIIIGGGPAGLATAIEARSAGAQVIVVEKRSAYEREQQLFLLEHSLALLKKWEVDPPELNTVEIGDRRIGFVQISQLEEALLKRAQELGVRVIQDEFVELSKSSRSVILRKGGALSYDILVAADGAHSPVRKNLGIEVNFLGQGKAGTAFFLSRKGDTPRSIEVSQAIQHGASFVKKFQFPEVMFIFLQGPNSAAEDDFITFCKASGWDSQAEQIEAGEALLLLDVDVYLQKARRFSLETQGALLVGDAAGTGSFFRGMGANHALETAEIAGRFLRARDYERFEAEMDKSTSSLIEDSAFLFITKNV